MQESLNHGGPREGESFDLAELLTERLKSENLIKAIISANIEKTSILR